MARTQLTAEQFNIAAKGTLTEVHQIIVATAKREHARIMTTDPVPNRFTRFVDGVQGAPEEDVKPAGVIQYDYPRLEIVIEYAMQVLFDLSPVQSGEYRKAHTLFLDGVAVANLKNWKAGDEISISNFVPYARKIELGKQKMKLPGTDHVYQQAEQIVRRRYGNVASIKFTFRGIVGGTIATGKSHGKSDLRYPALIIGER